MGAGAASYIAAHYRHTRMGAVTLPIAVRRTGGAITIVKPSAKYYSRSGTHSVFYFPADISAIIFLDQSNSGRRSVHVRCLTGDAQFCDALWRCAYLHWAVRRLGARDVIAALQSCR